MKTSIETADRVAKLVLSLGVILAYTLKLMSGPVAFALLVASIIIITLELIRIVMISSRD